MSKSKVFRQLVCLAVAAAFAAPLPAFAFGSLAVRSNHGGQFGWARGYATKDEADEAALQECGSNCTVVLQFWDGCGAYAADQDSGSTVYGWAVGRTQSEAENKAITECTSQGGGTCVVKVWSCE